MTVSGRILVLLEGVSIESRLLSALLTIIL